MCERRLIHQRCLAVRLVRKEPPGLATTPASSDTSGSSGDTSTPVNEALTAAASLDGPLLFRAWQAANVDCSWDGVLVEAAKAVQYLGHLVGGVVLVGGPAAALTTLTEAWSRSLLAAPSGYSLTMLGEVQGMSVAVVPQGQFTPLADALCWVVHHLTRDGCRAGAEAVREALEASFPTIVTPAPSHIHATLSGLIQQCKVYYTGTTYGIVQPGTYLPYPVPPPTRPPALPSPAVSPVILRDGLVTSAAQTDLAELITGAAQGMDRVVTPSLQGEGSAMKTKSESDFEHLSRRLHYSAGRASSLRLSPTRASILATHLAAAAAAAATATTTIHTYQAVDFSDISIRGERGSVFSKLLRVPGRRRVASFAAQFPPPEWSDDKAPVIHLHSIAVQTNTQTDVKGWQWLARQWTPRSSTLPRRLKQPPLSATPPPSNSQQSSPGPRGFTSLLQVHVPIQQPSVSPQCIDNSSPKHTNSNSPQHTKSNSPQHTSTSIQHSNSPQNSNTPQHTKSNSPQHTSTSIQHTNSPQHSNTPQHTNSNSNSTQHAASPRHTGSPRRNMDRKLRSQKFNSPVHQRIETRSCRHSSSSDDITEHRSPVRLKHSVSRGNPTGSSPLLCHTGKNQGSVVSHTPGAKVYKQQAVDPSNSEEKLLEVLQGTRLRSDENDAPSGRQKSCKLRREKTNQRRCVTGQPTHNKHSKPVKNKPSDGKVEKNQQSGNSKASLDNQHIHVASQNVDAAADNKQALKNATEVQQSEAGKKHLYQRSGLQLDLTADHMNNCRKVVASPQRPHDLTTNLLHQAPDLQHITKGSTPDLTSRNLGYQEVDKCHKKMCTQTLDQIHRPHPPSCHSKKVEESPSPNSKGSREGQDDDDNNTGLDKRSVGTYPSLSELNLTFSSLAAQKILSGASVNSLDTLAEVNMAALKHKSNAMTPALTNTDLGFV